LSGSLVAFNLAGMTIRHSAMGGSVKHGNFS
jgi:hypothetical protein